MATIVLVGHCNANPYLQMLIGTIVFRQNSKKQLEPFLIDIHVGDDQGTQSNPCELVFSIKRRGYYVFYCSLVGGSRVINLDGKLKRFTFLTGIGIGDSGAGGPIVNGGPELVSAIDQLFRPRLST